MIDIRNIEPTYRDFWEFKAWKNGNKTMVPQLRSQFQTDSEYENYMKEAQDMNISIENDPSILNKTNNVYMQNGQEQMSLSNEELIKTIDSELNTFPELKEIIDKFPEIKVFISTNNSNGNTNFDVNIVTKNQNGDVEQLGKAINKSREDIVNYVRGMARVKCIDGTWIVLNDEGHNNPADAVRAALSSVSMNQSFSSRYKSLSEYRNNRINSGHKWFSDGSNTIKTQLQDGYYDGVYDGNTFSSDDGELNLRFSNSASGSTKFKARVDVKDGIAKLSKKNNLKNFSLKHQRILNKKPIK